MPVDNVGGEVMPKGGHGCGLMVRATVCWAVCAPPAQLSIACTVKLNVPVVEGVPAISPDELIFRPEGKEPETTPKVIGDCPPDVVI